MAVEPIANSNCTTSNEVKSVEWWIYTSRLVVWPASLVDSLPVTRGGVEVGDEGKEPWTSA
eukprot:3313036-Amphidinium_carterae.1